MAKYVQPNFIVDSSAAFWRNVSFDSSVYLRGITHIDSSLISGSSESTPYALVVDSLGSDVEIKSLQLGTMATETADDYASLAYVDGSLAVRDDRLDALDASVEELDASVSYLFGWVSDIDASLNDTIDLLDIIDASFADVYGLIDELDASVDYLFEWNTIQDASIAALEAATIQTWNGLTTSTDNSVGLGGALDVSTTITTSAANTLTIAGLQTSSGDTPLAVVMDAANQELKVRQLGTMAWATAADYATLAYVDGSLSERDDRLDALDASVDDLRSWNEAQDSSIEDLQTWNTALDASVDDLWAYNTIQDTSIAALSGAQRQAWNGLSLDDNSIGLGGTLVDDTDIDTDGNTFSITGGLNIYGTLTVDGSVTYVNVVDLNVSDNIITINYGETGPGVSKGYAGIKVDRGPDASAYMFLFAETTDTFRIGIADEDGLPGETQAVATRQDNPVVNGIGYWNNTLKRIDTTAGFTFDASGLSIPTVLTDNSATTALFLDGSDVVVKRTLGTGAFADIGDFATLAYVDGSLAVRDDRLDVIDGSIAELDSSMAYIFDWVSDIDASLNDTIDLLDIIDASFADVYNLIDEVSTNKLTDVANVPVAGDASVYSHTTDNVAYLKKLAAGAGVLVTEDSSTITISSDASAGVFKHTGTFDGTADVSLGIPAATHGIGTGPFIVSVFDNREQVYVDVSYDAQGDITLEWAPGSLSDTCAYIITG